MIQGVWVPRVRRDGTPLPSARLITLSIVPDANLPDLRYSHMLMQFGQFVDHDLSHVPIFRFQDLTGIQCCSSNLESDISHPACFPIEIPSNDFQNRGLPCMNFVRSVIGPRFDCSFGHADQVSFKYYFN
jgi:peroxidase